MKDSRAPDARDERRLNGLYRRAPEPRGAAGVVDGGGGRSTRWPAPTQCHCDSVSGRSPLRKKSEGQTLPRRPLKNLSQNTK